MAIRKIVRFGDSVLEKECRKVEKFDKKLHQLLDDMKETLADADGAGLAAPQVGILRAVCVVDVGEGPIELVNPEIIATEGEQNGAEGCLSYPGEFGLVKRPMKVTVKAQDRHGNPVEYEREGVTARCFCHEIEHLDGHMYYERAGRLFTEAEVDEMLQKAEEEA